MKYPDLSSYSHSPAFLAPGLLNFGWLDGAEQLAAVSDADAAGLLIRYLPFRVARTRGLHLCPFCPAPRQLTAEESRGVPGFLERPTRQEVGGYLLGSAEIRVFGAEGERFAAPDLVVHYVSTHGYVLPPAVARALLQGPEPGSEAYRDLLETVAPSQPQKR